MATEHETGKVTCPCCQATLVIDRETLSILYATESREKAGGASFEEAVRELKTKEMQKGARFQQAVDEEKQRRALLSKKFQELQRKAAAEPDAPPPPRPFDFE